MDTHSIEPGVYNYKVTVYADESDIFKASQLINFKIESTPLQTFIKGGNRMAGYSSPLKIEGVAKDIDVKPEL